MEENNIGPQTRTVLSFSYKTCNGCVYFKSKGVVFGHDFVDKKTTCSHPDVLNMKDEPKIIHHRIRTHENYVPLWCPVINDSEL